jgi:hypothetical protein
MFLKVAFFKRATANYDNLSSNQLFKASGKEIKHHIPFQDVLLLSSFKCILSYF